MQKSNKNHEYDCTRKCSLRRHGNEITAALSKRSLNDNIIGAYLAKTCCNYANVVDDLGRSALHLAASVDRYAILEWLLNQGGQINLRDGESGSTPLHRALFYGCIDCAVLLLRYGANLSMQDVDTYFPLQNICRLMDLQSDADNGRLANELLVWGSNKNYNLGIGIEESPNTPQPLDYFRKKRIHVIQAAIGSFHSLFLDDKFNLYATGHGKGGRLGNKDENSLPAPRKIKVHMRCVNEYITCISVSNKHSLVLTNLAVYACGLNEDQQLGVDESITKWTVFKEVVALRSIETLTNVIARDEYSVAYSNTYVYCWGRNFGQFFNEKFFDFIDIPAAFQLRIDERIKSVDCNKTAVVVLSSKSILYLLKNYTARTINPPNYHHLKSVYVHGGDTINNGKGTASALKLLLVEESNSIIFWYEKTKLFYRCDSSQIRLKEIDKLIYKGNKILILSRGNVYEGKCQQVETPSYYSETNSLCSWSSFINPPMVGFSTAHMIRLELQRLPNVDRVFEIYANEDFSSFAVLQEDAYKYFKVPTLPMEPYNFEKLYSEANEDDAVHDVVFNIDGQNFPAHKFIIFARSLGLRNLVRNNSEKTVHLKMEKLTGKMFELMLKHIYINYLPVTKDMNDVQQSLGPDNTLSMHEICQLFLSFVKIFHLEDLANYLKK